MNKAELIKALKQLKIQTGSLVCLGCGHEHSCTTKGCAVIRAAMEELEKLEIPKLQIGDSVFFVLLDDGEWRISEERIVEVGKNGFFLSQISGGTEPNDYIPYSKMGEEWFFEKEDAEEKRQELNLKKSRISNAELRAKRLGVKTGDYESMVNFLEEEIERYRKDCDLHRGYPGPRLMPQKEEEG